MKQIEAAIEAYREGVYLTDEQVFASVSKIVDAANAWHLQQDGGRDLPYDRDTLGRFVREAWVRWAEEQPNPKQSWLVPYDELSEADKEADRQIGEAVARWTLIGDAALASHTSALAEKDEEIARLREALQPLSRLEIPRRPQGNAGAYSIRLSDIEAARSALTDQQKG